MAKERSHSVREEARSRFIKDYVHRAFGLREDAKRQSEEKRYAEAVSTVQQALELLVKALFHEASVAPPRSHRIRDPRFGDRLVSLSDALKAALSPAKWQRLNLPRLFFIASFWGEFYLDAKYGSELLGAGPSQLLGPEEARLALAHFDEVVETLNDVFIR